MNIEEAIRTRRSIGKVKSDPVPRELVEKIIEAATWAPNHFKTEPWKFIVMTGDGRNILGNAYAEIAESAYEGASQTEAEQAERRSKEMAKAMRAPLVIAAVCSPSEDTRVIAIEELAAAHAAVQNLLLVAHANELGAVWRTGEPMYHPLMKRAFRLTETETLVGLLYIGYPDIQQPVATRLPTSQKTVWFE